MGGHGDYHGDGDGDGDVQAEGHDIDGFPNEFCEGSYAFLEVPHESFEVPYDSFEGFPCLF